MSFLDRIRAAANAAAADPNTNTGTNAAESTPPAGDIILIGNAGVTVRVPASAAGRSLESLRIAYASALGLTGTNISWKNAGQVLSGDTQTVAGTAYRAFVNAEEKGAASGDIFHPLALQPYAKDIDVERITTGLPPLGENGWKVTVDPETKVHSFNPDQLHWLAAIYYGLFLPDSLVSERIGKIGQLARVGAGPAVLRFAAGCVMASIDSLDRPTDCPYHHLARGIREGSRPRGAEGTTAFDDRAAALLGACTAYAINQGASVAESGQLNGNSVYAGRMHTADGVRFGVRGEVQEGGHRPGAEVLLGVNLYPKQKNIVSFD